MSVATTASHDAAPTDRRRSLALPGRVVAWLGGVLALAIAGALFTRFGIDDWLRRDESIYTYGGQQLAHGVAPYVSIFDPKAPLATILAGAGAAWARLTGGDDVHVIRLLFLAFSCLTVGAVYALGVGLWRSAVAALAAAVVFASFRGFAIDAIGGPDAKTPGILLGVLAMALLARRRWFWGALAGALAALVWQPLVVYPLAGILGAPLVAPRGTRRRATVAALAGTAIPVAAILAYFALAGALPQFVEAAIRFPLVGVSRGHETVGQRLDFIARTVSTWYPHTGVLFWLGSALLPVAAVVRLVRTRTLADPLISVVLLTWLPLVAFSARDFQGYPDLYPLLPYAAVGIGAAVAGVRSLLPGRVARLATAAVVLAGVAVLVAGSWVTYSRPAFRNTELRLQRAQAGALLRLTGPRGTLYALGDPTPLVLTHRRNPDRFIYLGSGVARWKVKHTPGRFAGWTRQIRRWDPAVITVAGWDQTGRWAVRMRGWFETHHYVTRYVGRLRVVLPPRTLRRAARLGVPLSLRWKSSPNA